MSLRGGTNIGRGNANIDAVMSTSGTTPLDFARLFYNANEGLGNNSSWNITDEDGVTGPITHIVPTGVPSANNDPGRPGQIRFDASHIYFCVDENTWIRAVRDTF